MKSLFTFIAVSLCICSVGAARPNVLFFLVDDMGIQDLSEPFAYSADGKPVITAMNKLYRTPNVERLAAKGVKFTNAYAYSVCSPTRISIMTGQAAPRHRVTQWTHPQSWKVNPGPIKTKTIRNPDWRVRGIPPDTTLLTHLMHKAEYVNLFAGKAHFGPDDTDNGDPLNLAFDVNIAGYGGGGPGSYFGKYNYSAAHRKGGREWDVPGLEAYHGTDTYLTEALTLEMNKAIARTVDANKPFFAYFSHYAVHAPFLYPDPRFAHNYPKLKGYGLAFATLVEGVDKSLGDCIAHLERLGVAEDTLVIFYSDNGSASPLGTPGLRGKKGTRFEGGNRVPLIVAWAKQNPENRWQKQYPIEAGSRNDTMVTCLDVMPTLLELAGVTAPAGLHLDGESILKQISGRSHERQRNSFLVHFPHRHANTLFSTYLRDDDKIVYNYASEAWELYDLKNDVEEKRNLVAEQPQKARELATAMIAQLDAYDAQYPIRLDGGAAAKPNLNKLPALSPTPTD